MPSLGPRRLLGGRGLIAAFVALIAFSACQDDRSPTLPLRPTNANRTMTGGNVVVVKPDSLHGWTLVGDGGTSCCTLVNGPGTPPIGTGSLHIVTPTNTGASQAYFAGYGGTKFSQITALSYSTYRQSPASGGSEITFQVNADFDLTDGDSTSFQGRLIYAAGNGDTSIHRGTWQTWDMQTTGKWYGTSSTVIVGGHSVNNPCVAGASACTWAQLLAAFPNVGIHHNNRIFLRKEAGTTGFDGNVDDLTIGVNGTNTTYDFELTSSSPVPALPPNQSPSFPAGGVIPGGAIAPDSVQRGAVAVEFFEGTAQPQRQAAVDAVHGTVIGGNPVIDGDGFYYLNIPDDGTANSIASALAILHTLPQVEVAIPIAVNRNEASFWRPIDGDADFRHWNIDPTLASGKNWGLQRVRAPQAWGCTTGSLSTNIGVVDEG